VNDSIRVGVLGAGGIAQVAHLPVLRRLPGAEVAAICDNDLGKAQALAARFDVKDTYDDIEEVLRYANVDVVVVCTPNHLHEIHATAALAAAHGATPIILVPQFGHDDERDQGLRRTIFEETGLSYVFVEIDPAWRIPWDRHPDARAARAIAERVAAVIRDARDRGASRP